MLETEHALQVGMNLLKENKGNLAQANRYLTEQVEQVFGPGIWVILLAEYNRLMIESKQVAGK